MRSWAFITLAVAAAAFAAGWFTHAWRGAGEAGGTEANGPPPERAAVARIVDAATIELDTGHTVRYLGVRPPPTAESVQCFGPEAVKANESIIGKAVRLEEDPVLTRAQDGAWVRYVYMVDDVAPTPSVPPADGTTPPPAGGETAPTPEPGQSPVQGEAPPATPAGEPATEAEPQEIFINERILEGGFAFPVVSPDMRYGERMLSAARFASATGKGLWSRCEVTEDERGLLQTQTITDCTIKGTVSRNFEKLYRTPQCAGYAEMRVLESQGGRWFCGSDTARDAGFTPAPDCPGE